MRYLDGPRPRLFAHRGASGAHPENTLPAFRAGLAAGADRLELDVHATLDGEIVVLHDARVDRTTDGQGDVRSLTAREVRGLDAGYRFVAADGSYPHRGLGICIPTLAELLAAHPDVPLNVEIKQADPPIVERVLAVLDEHGARERTLLAAEHDAIMAHIRTAAPDVVTSHSAAEVADFVYRLRDGRLQGYRPPGIAFQVPPSHGDVVIVSEESVRVAHALGAEVHVWTINDAPRMEALLALGVDGLMTDVPAVAARLLGR
jgi:glycerophosphoryl diester phosphodiesterase